MSQPSTASLIDVAESNASAAYDQRGDYDSLAEAWWAYDQNVTDTVLEQGGTHAQVCEAGAIYRWLFAVEAGVDPLSPDYEETPNG